MDATNTTQAAQAKAKVDAQIKAVRKNADAYARRLISHAEWKAQNAAVWSAR
jgi:hypothetical protein